MLRSPQMRSKKDSPSGDYKAGLLARSYRNAFPVIKTSGFSMLRQLSELTAAGTAADFHGIPI